MTVQIPLSIVAAEVGDPDAFAAVLAAHAIALQAHRAGPPGVPVPLASPLVTSLVASVHRGDPHPDSFEVLPYTVFDDTPPPPPPPTLAELKAPLLSALYAAADATRNALLSPARAQLLGMDAMDAMSLQEELRSPSQVAVIEAYTAFVSRNAEIERNLTLAAIEIEELDATSVAAWKVPGL